MFTSPRPKLYCLIALLGLALPLVSGCASHSETVLPIQAEDGILRVSYKAGQAISIITPEPKSGEAAKAAMSDYFATSFPLASNFGLEAGEQLRVKTVVHGTHQPTVAVFYSYPDAASEAALTAHPDWPSIKAKRPAAWEELRVYTTVLKEDVSLTFKPSKTYTMAVAWLNPEKPNDYAAYMTGIQSAVTASGGRFVYEMHDPAFEAHARPKDAPGQVTLVEWDSPAGLANFQKTDGFKQNAKYLSSGTTDFELMVLGTS